MTFSHWIFLSPHFDDVALSCGGLVYSLTQQGHRVEIWTIMAGFPPDDGFSQFAEKNHRAWGMAGAQAIRMRMGEDQAACAILGARPRHWHWPDAIYRREVDSGFLLVEDNEELFSKRPEDALISEIAQTLNEAIPREVQTVFPLSLGNHIDHQAVFAASELFQRKLLYYADYPYILENFDHPIFNQKRIEKLPLTLSPETLGAWQEAVLCYKSQLSGFWRDEIEARLALRNYAAGGGGGLLKMNPEERETSHSYF
jgi:LmbE family N-acetylglucosaminyl deacetylase